MPEVRHRTIFDKLERAALGLTRYESTLVQDMNEITTMRYMRIIREMHPDRTWAVHHLPEGAVVVRLA